MKKATISRIFLQGDFEFVYRRYIESLLYYSPKRLIPGWQKIKIDRPVFFLGVQGGGMTLVVRMLARNRRVITSTGNYKKWAFRDELAMQYGGLLPDVLTSQFYFYKPFLYQQPELLNPGQNLEEKDLLGVPELYRNLYLQYGCLAWWNYASSDLLPYFRSDSNDYRVEDAQQFIALLKKISFIGLPLGDQEDFRLVDKSQIFSLKVSLIEKILGDVQPIYIVVLRNPYAICFRAATTGYIAERNLNFEKRLHVVAQHYANTYKYIFQDLEFVEEDRKFVFRIEDFLLSPRDYLQKICSMCNINFDDDMLPRPEHKIPWGAGDKNKWYPLRPDVNRRYLGEIDEVSRKIIEQYVSGVTKILVYSAYIDT